MLKLHPWNISAHAPFLIIVLLMVLVSCLLSMHSVLCLSSPCNLLPGHDVYHVQGMDWRQTCTALAQLSTEQQPAKDAASTQHAWHGSAPNSYSDSQ
ncbi:hypothetical protein JKP88DRAFT_50557 [Tribonema minus]|uniref:Uncharacterized protein n=1 Tax=Tribonema minus TaxID=303371 RepID=A0A836CG93_9STRA|nr:hypothetical protein JKP88DRAFT_50557 [Tribonema minus]